MKLWAMRGLSGSGKSTRAAGIAGETGAVVVCRDNLRWMLLGSWWTGRKEDEDRVTVAEEAQVVALLRAGHSVVVDNTHLHPPYLRKWARLATRLGVAFEVVDVHADVDECKRRVYARWQRASDTDAARYIDPSVIDRQAKRWPAGKWPAVTAEPFIVEPVEWVEGLPEAIICDVDGTLAHMNGRSPFDYSRVTEDALDPIVRGIVDDWRNADGTRHVLIVSGRDDTCRLETLEWLNDNDIFYDRVFMRPADAKDGRGGKLPDYRVKYDIFNREIRGKYNIRFCIDDRRQVIDMWRTLRLKVLDVAGNEF